MIILSALLGFWTLSIVRSESKNPIFLTAIHHRQNPLETFLVLINLYRAVELCLNSFSYFIVFMGV